METLKDINFKLTYDSSNDNLLKDFFEPALSVSIIYKRGVGYFTSGWLYHNARGIAFLLNNGGKIKFITSPNIDKKDLNYLQGKYEPTIVDNLILKNIDEIELKLKEDYRNLLGWLVYDKIVEFKFAVPKPHLLNGEFHDKFGIFIDKENNIVAFNGSINDSFKGFLNYESISVFPAWKDDTCLAIANEQLKRFDILWENADPNLDIFPLSDIVEKRLIKLRESTDESTRPYDLSKYKQSKPYKPLWLNLRGYQKDAIKAWLGNNGKGIISMATGSGKTITALMIVNKLVHALKKIALLVVVPYKHLLEQWSSEGENFNINFIKCNSDYKNWEQKLNSKITNFLLNSECFLPIITTNATFRTKKFQDLLSKLDKFFLIVDEVHNWGSSELINKYPDRARYRLGLSATPKRHFDEEGTQAISNFFGDIVFEYSLKDAIESGNLCQYYYFPVLVNLTVNEEEEYVELTKSISSLLNVLKNKEKKENISMLLQKDIHLKELFLKRSKILDTAENKINKLEEILKVENLIKSKLNLFYVASKNEIDENQKVIKYLDLVLNKLNELGMFVKKFTAEEDRLERNYLLDQLKEGIINGLVAIRCLDEGVDIPNIERAFILASSSNPKEFVQRRGRILRKYSTKKYAYIYDFIVVPNLNNLQKNSEIFKIERYYLQRELKRFKEFASLAENKYEAEEKIMKIKEMYDLMHI